MALNPKEQLLFEAVRNMLDDTALGVKAHKDLKQDDSNTFTFLHEEIEQAYRLETIDLEHQDAICSAFSKIHSYKYLNDTSFNIAFTHEMASRAVPLDEQSIALEAVQKVIKKYLAETHEKDAGWNPNIDDIKKVSQPVAEGKSREIPKNQYDIERQFYSNPKVRKWINNNKLFWEATNRRIAPQLVKLGYDCNSPKTFWEAYDDQAAEFAIRDDMHFLFPPLLAQWNRPIAEGLGGQTVYFVQDLHGWPVAIVNSRSPMDSDGDWKGSLAVRALVKTETERPIDELVVERIPSLDEGIRMWNELENDTALMNDRGPEPFTKPEPTEPRIINV